MTANLAPVQRTVTPFDIDCAGWQNWLGDHIDPAWRPGEWNQDCWLFTGDLASPRTAAVRCRTPRCRAILASRGRCRSCTRGREMSGLAWEEFDVQFVPSDRPRGNDPALCEVGRGSVRCGRVGIVVKLCKGHYSSWRRHNRQRGRRLPIGEWVDAFGIEPLPAPPECSVGGCGNRCISELSPICNYHQRRWLESGHKGTADTPELRRWAAQEPPVLTAAQFSLVQLPQPLRLELAYGIQQRDVLGSTVQPFAMRAIISGALAAGTSLLLSADTLRGRMRTTNEKSVLRQLIWSVHQGYVAFSGRDLRGEDHFDLRAAGLKGATRSGRRRQFGSVDLTVIPQPWLRLLLRRRAEAEKPRGPASRRWLKSCVLAGRGMNRLPGGGIDTVALDFTHMQAAFDEIAAAVDEDGRLYSAGYRGELWTVFCQTTDFGRLAGLLDAPGSFIRRPSQRVPDEDPNEDELGKAIPEHVIRQLDAQLASFGTGVTYGAMDPAHVRAMFQTAYVVLRDSGRRPLEVVSLPRNCLERERDEVSLIWNNHKGRRMRRRLPITSSTVAAIEQWRAMRDALPGAPSVSEPYLFPAMTSAGGSDHLMSNNFSAALRTWVDNLGALDSDVLDAEGNVIPFDRSLIYPYAFRHTFAQRHADAGTPVDVLRDLMDHDDPKTTMGYYRVSLERKRRAVKTLSLMVTDRHGTAAPCSSIAYEQRSVAVPFGGCTEPSNVKAGGHACPIRFQCSGCGFYRPDPSYLPAIEDHANSLRADRERAWAMDAASFVIDNLTAQIASYEDVAAKMREGMAALPKDDRTELEEAAAVLRRVRAGGDRTLLPLTVVSKNGA
ncbi:site-specific integrase [Streptomyces massasporeus]|uniref:tyrosine-type recombinase/integrase n=1 Tax=Streptomyces massasporeus TaxID=67324 RepID=UPI0033E221B7